LDRYCSRVTSADLAMSQHAEVHPGVTTIDRTNTRAPPGAPNKKEMIVYNVTYKIRWSILKEWLLWQKEEHIVRHMDTGFFDDWRMFRLLDQDEEEGPTYIIQYFTTDLRRYEQFVIGFAPSLQRASWDKWGDRFIAFRTLMSSELEEPEN